MARVCCVHGTIVTEICCAGTLVGGQGPRKHLSDLDPVYIPTNLTIHKGTGIAFLDADAP